MLRLSSSRCLPSCSLSLLQCQSWTWRADCYFSFLPRVLHRQSSDSHETQLTCRVEASSPVTGASNYHCLLPYQCPYPPAVPCLQSETLWAPFFPFVCMLVLLWTNNNLNTSCVYPCSSVCLNLGQTLLEFRLAGPSRQTWFLCVCNWMCKCVLSGLHDRLPYDHCCLVCDRNTERWNGSYSAVLNWFTPDRSSGKCSVIDYCCLWSVFQM